MEDAVCLPPEEVSNTTGTILHGYGARLDIRNVEYISYEENEVNEKNLNIFPNQEKLKSFLFDVDDTLLRDRTGISLENISYESLEENDIPHTKLKDLPLKASSIIGASADPLRKLKDISQNLPSHLPYLLHFDTSTELRSNATSFMENLFDDESHLFVNNFIVDVSKPTFNLFDLLQILRQQYIDMKQIYDQLDFISSSDTKNSIFRDIKDEILRADIDTSTSAPPLRIDVARKGKGSIIYLNNIEKDPEFASWPRSLNFLFYSGQGENVTECCVFFKHHLIFALTYMHSSKGHLWCGAIFLILFLSSIH